MLDLFAYYQAMISFSIFWLVDCSAGQLVANQWLTKREHFQNLPNTLKFQISGLVTCLMIGNPKFKAACSKWKRSARSHLSHLFSKRRILSRCRWTTKRAKVPNKFWWVFQQMKAGHRWLDGQTGRLGRLKYFLVFVYIAVHIGVYIAVVAKSKEVNTACRLVQTGLNCKKRTA